ncbi:biopolymer transporter ExbD [Neorhodopirellula pilleata]|uniref:Biopolymer transport protein ExbD/TolR n=1 Tax=Neorhodopirellula pilleata TaxID=2714738 RepID=A0A5C6AR94_9BACT|nr:biopolymer transporter ExbD [Neorhodopirellula pilleata]TWU02088.1 Biopolymer transport protein ExbD/TolR [Neorhodopirellula pilleata]
MRPPSHANFRRDSDDLAMTSMIDVVFLLLVFFVWTSSFDLPETSLPGSIALAPSKTPPETMDESMAVNPDLPMPSLEVKPTEIIVRIIDHPGGKSYRVGAVELADLSAVKRKLSKISDMPIATMVVVDPDPAISVSDTIDVFDFARSLKFSKVLLAVEPDLELVP